MNYIERYWRDATPADAIKEPPMVARFSNEYCPDWVIDKLIYWDRSETPWYREDGFCYDLCQVYDAPDPGDGWRLIDVEKETPKEGDQYFAQSSKVWCFYNDVTRIATYSKGSIIRRRITPAVTYIPFTWEDRDQLRGRWYTITLSCDKIREYQIEFLRLSRNVLYIGSFTSAELLEKNARFLDTGEPVGRKVME